VDRRDGLQPLGEEQADAIAPAHAPAREASGEAVGGSGEIGISQRAAWLVFDGGMIGPPRGGFVE
jgi:hypothetical protein